MRTPTHCSTLVVRALFWLPVLLALAGCSSMSGYQANRMGTAYYRRGDYTAAAYEFRRAAIDNPRNADYAYNLASAMKRQGDMLGAEQSYNNALLTNPAHQPSYHGLAVLLNEQKRTAEADQLIETWAKAEPASPAAHIELAWLKSERGDYATAEQSLQQALAIRPDHPVALAQLGQLYERTGQHDRAAAMYQQSLQANWYNPQVQTRLASIQQPMQAGGMPVFAQNPGPMTAQGQPLNGYAQYQPYQPLPSFAENAPVYGGPASTPEILSSDPSPQFTAESAFPRVATQPPPQPATGRTPTLGQEPVHQWTPAAESAVPSNEAKESESFSQPAPSTPAEEPLLNEAPANADPAHAQ